MAKVARFQFPDGRIGRFEVPDGTTPDQAQGMIEAEVSRQTQAAAPRPTDMPSQIPGVKPAPTRTLTNDNPNVIDKGITNFLAENPRVANIIERMAGQGSPFGRFVQGAADLPVGVMQLGMNAVGNGDIVNPEIAAINRRTEQLRGADAGSADWWRLAGNVSNPAPWKAFSAMKAAPTAMQRIGQAAGLGAVSGIQPVTEGNYAKKAATNALKSAALSSVIPIGADFGSKIIGGAKNIIGPMLSKEGADLAAGRVARAAAGDRVDDVIANLQSANRNVNAGQAALPAGSAEFSALQAAANKIKPSEAVALAETQAGRRAGAIERIAGGADDTAMNTAREFRAIQGAKDYGDAGSKLVESDNFFNMLMARPSMQKAISRAEQLAKEKNEAFSFGKTLPERVESGLIVSKQGEPLSKTVIPATKEKFSVESLHKIKMGLDDLIKSPDVFGISKAELSAISNTRKAFVGWLENKAPLYQTARENFAAASGPINRMEVGREMQKKLASAIGEKPGTYLNTLNDAAQVLKTATGYNRYNNLGEVLTPREMKVVNAVGKQLENEIRLRTLAKAGAEKTRKIVGDSQDTVPQVNMLKTVATVFNQVSRRLETGASEKSMEALAEMMIKDPRYMAKVMIAAKPAERSAIIDGLIRLQAIPVGASVEQ